MNWTALPSSHISSRSHHSSVFARDSIYIFGGYDGDNYLCDIKKYNITQNSWSDVTPENSDGYARCGHSSVVCGEKMIIFGGYDSMHHNDILAFNLETNQWEQENVDETFEPPSKRWCHSCVMDELHHFMWIFAGFGECKEGKTKLYLNDTHKYDINRKVWSPVATHGTIPKRNNHTAIIHKNRMFIFGGSKLNDLWFLDLNHYTWNQIETTSLVLNQPGNVYGHTACVKGNQMYIFGGRFDSYKRKVYRYNLDTGKWTLMSTDGQKPTKRRNHTAVMNPYTNQMYVFGGYGGEYLNDFSLLKLNVVPTKLGAIKPLRRRELVDVLIYTTGTDGN